jgi:tRNA (adenine-N(1)-)-methyltransferase non-catalytic subunit
LIPTALTLTSHYFATKPEKSQHLRIDTLSQILSLANIHSSPTFRVLIFDETNGVLTAGILDRMQQGHVMFISTHEGCSALQAATGGHLEAVRYLPKSIRKWAFGTDRVVLQGGKAGHEPEGGVLLISFKQLVALHSSDKPDEPEIVEADVPSDIPVEETEAGETVKEAAYRKEKKASAFTHRLNRAKQQLQTPYDALIIATSPLTQPLPILHLLSPLVAGGRPIVIYSAYKEGLDNVWMQMRQSPEYVNVDLSESWLRVWGVKQSRGHPEMNMSGSGGFVLSATKVLKDDLIIQKGRKRPRE